MNALKRMMRVGQVTSAFLWLTVFFAFAECQIRIFTGRSPDEPLGGQTVQFKFSQKGLNNPQYVSSQTDENGKLIQIFKVKCYQYGKVKIATLGQETTVEFECRDSLLVVHKVKGDGEFDYRPDYLTFRYYE